MHKRDWVHLTYCHGHALQLVDGDTIKAIKIIRGSLDAAFELTKVIKCSPFLKLQEKNKILPKRGRSFQQVKERQCSRKLWWHNIMPRLLNCQRGIVTKHFRVVSHQLWDAILKSRFKSSKSCHRCSNANAKFQFLF